MFRSICIVLIIFISTLAQAQQGERVFMIGENQKLYDKIMVSYDEHLLEVCNNSMDEAYKKWTDVLYDMEKFAMAADFDIRGVKLWMNVFFNKSGKIDYLVFYPKPVSKNMDFEKLKDILTDFVAVYKTNITAEQGFSHYGSASFPVFYTRYQRDNE